MDRKEIQVGPVRITLNLPTDLNEAVHQYKEPGVVALLRRHIVGAYKVKIAALLAEGLDQADIVKLFQSGQWTALHSLEAEVLLRVYDELDEDDQVEFERGLADRLEARRDEPAESGEEGADE